MSRRNVPSSPVATHYELLSCPEERGREWQLYSHATTITTLITELQCKCTCPISVCYSVYTHQYQRLLTVHEGTWLAHAVEICCTRNWQFWAGLLHCSFQCLIQFQRFSEIQLRTHTHEQTTVCRHGSTHRGITRYGHSVYIIYVTCVCGSRLQAVYTMLSFLLM